VGNANKALVGFVLGALILGTVGFLVAPHLLMLAGIKVVAGYIAFPGGVFSWSTPGVVGITYAAFGQLEAGITALAGLIGGLAGGMISAATSKKECNSALDQHTSFSSVASPANEKTAAYSPSRSADGPGIEKSFVKNYEQEKLTGSQTPPSQWLH
jgi:hypothetical protein